MIVVVGEALVDVVTGADGSASETPGGSPLNVAVGCARLGCDVTLLTQVGDDPRGGTVVAHVTGSGARIVAAPTSHGRTSVARATLDASGAATYDFDLEWSLPRQELPECRALHVGSLGTVLEPGRERVLDLVSQAVHRHLVVSYDVNVRESFVPDAAAAWRDVRALAASCALVKLSDEDALALDPAGSPDDTARALLGGERTSLVILTRGPRGATAFTATGAHDVTPRPTAVVDTVGAGDAFMAAVLAQLDDEGALVHDARPGDLAPEVLQAVLAGAVEVAAITCERRGANPPRRDELPASWRRPA